MQVHALDKANLITDVQLGNHLSHAVTQGRRSDFALMLALLSGDATETTPLNPTYPEKTTDAMLRQALELPEPNRLAAEEIDYELCGEQASAFHSSSITSARFNHCVTPSALHFPAHGTHDLGEDVYHNLSGHTRRQLAEEKPNLTAYDPVNLYNQLVLSKRFQELNTTV
ncbi:VC2046/SO_2500 family protein [Enterovibrio coralii]|uniref:Queuosine biosynthesis protein QueD n=1 Tax=Enterovibrio coralii TaxID=294935 RepID=A0A135I7T5_9GAMM|nr:VC2046/SO_2500 family protein [Enterovibrio coralii]KXF81511.1 queuosine biosynthesis protein QueD [Enterovibrio coralii]